MSAPQVRVCGSAPKTQPAGVKFPYQLKLHSSSLGNHQFTRAFAFANIV
jgi:hypothetical protein